MYQEYDYFLALQGNDPCSSSCSGKKITSSIVILIRDSFLVKNRYATCKKYTTPHKYLLFTLLPSKIKSSHCFSFPEDLLAKQGAQSFIKYSKPFISKVSVLGKVIFEFTMILINSKSVSKYLLGFAECPIFLF